MGKVKEDNSKTNQNKVKNPAGINKKPTRSKMPNFEAIHKKHFKEMESILEHVTRKAERAKELTKSTIKKSNKKPSESETPGNSVIKRNTSVDKISQNNVSKARLKLNFADKLPIITENVESNDLKIQKVLKACNNKDNLPKRKLKSSFSNTDQKDKSNATLLINKKLNDSRKEEINNLKKCNLKCSSSLPSDENENGNKVPLKDKIICNTGEKMIKTENDCDKKGHLKKYNLRPSSTTSSLNLNKDKQPQKQHIHLYKSRQVLTDKNKTKRNEYVKNIRVNRRFELQMACRNRI